MIPKFNRQIKFRAWDRNKKVIREVNEINFATENITCLPVKGVDDFSVLYYPVCFKGEYDLMQWTGYIDIGEDEIYEGYILWDALAEEHGLVVLSDGRWDAVFGNVHCNLCDGAREWQVVGNIYETLELLEGEIENN